MPADPTLLRIARLTAAALAARMDFSFDEIEDVKIAVDELCFSLVGTRGRPGTVTLDYRLGADEIEIHGTGPRGGPLQDASTSELSAQILAAVVDDHQLSVVGDELHFHVRKRRTT